MIIDSPWLNLFIRIKNKKLTYMALRFYTADVRSASSSELEKFASFLVYQLYQRAETTIEHLVAFSCATGVTGKVLLSGDCDEELELTGRVPEGMEVSQELIDSYKGVDVQRDIIDPYVDSLPKYEEREDWE